MKVLKVIFLAGGIAMSWVAINAQESLQSVSLNESSIDGQFRYVMQRSDDVDDFEMVKRWHLYTLKKHVQDSLDAKQALLDSTVAQVVAGQKCIDSLRQANNVVSEKYRAAVVQKETLYFLGIPMHKSGYHKLVWSLIVVLLVATALSLMLFQRSNLVTRETKNSLDELRAEFESFRKRALEREEGIVRKYHNEINKLKEQGTAAPTRSKSR